MKIYNFPYNSKENSAAPSPPMVPQVTYIVEKYEISVFTGKTNQHRRHFRSFFTIFKITCQNDPKYVDSGV